MVALGVVKNLATTIINNNTANITITPRAVNITLILLLLLSLIANYQTASTKTKTDTLFTTLASLLQILLP